MTSTTITQRSKYINRFEKRDKAIYSAFKKGTPIIDIQFKYRMTSANVYRIVKQMGGKHE
jgi:Mor family transcriptional regulator